MLTPGTQIEHVGPDGTIRLGFVTSIHWDGEQASCRFWKPHTEELANPDQSELVLLKDLAPVDSRDQQLVYDLFEKLYAVRLDFEPSAERHMEREAQIMGMGEAKEND